ncbi:hypothetical protein, partial [Longimicrobium sp.]|uniref:hypothetical protein n=1 Tax=Longimicrobium sp. TaxID=2029185 RepID=UPI002E37ED8B
SAQLFELLRPPAVRATHAEERFSQPKDERVGPYGGELSTSSTHKDDAADRSRPSSAQDDAAGHPRPSTSRQRDSMAGDFDRYSE